MLSNFIKKMRAKYYWWSIRVFGKVLYRDRYGLKYYLWKDTRPYSSVDKRVSTDDAGVLNQVFAILDVYALNDERTICIDVGAHVGVVTLAMIARSAPSSDVHAVEPNARNFGRLVTNLRFADDRVNVRTHRLALSDTNGHGQLKLTSDPGQHHLTSTQEGSKDQIEMVELSTLTSLADKNSISDIHLLKVDAEGADDKILTGAGRLLIDHRISYLIIEVIEGDPCGNNVLSILRSNSYQVYFMVRDTDQLVRDPANYPSGEHKSYMNVLAVSPDAPYFQGGEGLNVLDSPTA